MRTEKQLLQLSEARKSIKNRKCSEETKAKIGNANRKPVVVICSYCKNRFITKPSKIKKNKRFFCCQRCYWNYISEILPKEEQPRYGSGYSLAEKEKRSRARSIFNHHIRDKHIERKPCEICGESKTQAHHDDYDKPLAVRWLCLKHHREWHKVHDNPELLEAGE